MTTLADVLAALQSALEADPRVGLEGESAGHLAVVAPNVDWIPAPLPSAAVLVAETERSASIDGFETVLATVEVRLAIDGLDGRGDMAGIIALVELVRQCVIEHERLATDAVPTGLIGASQPTGESYAVLSIAERGWLQTATFRWRATWRQPRTFDDAPLVDARYVRVLTVVPGVGVTEQQPPAEGE